MMKIFPEVMSDAELMQGVHEIASQQGIYACPEGGAVWAPAKQLTPTGWLKPDERIVLFNTGTGLKYNHLLEVKGLPRLDHARENVMDESAKLV